MSFHPKDWTCVDAGGLRSIPGSFYVDPGRAVEIAIITHGHADHAVRGHGTVVATPETLAIMEVRYGKRFCTHQIPLGIHESMSIADTVITFYPAGHVLGSVQIQVEYGGQRLGISGDYKRGGNDPTCAEYESMPCDVFLTEATFAYPLFKFPDPWVELGKLLHSTRLFPERPHVIAAYSLGKAQRVIASLRSLGFQGRIFAHSTVVELNRVYEDFGIPLGKVLPIENYRYDGFGNVSDVIVSPQSGKLDLQFSAGISPVYCGASGWNSMRKHALSSQLEIPMVISDHCDWDQLQKSILETGAKEIWVTHGPADSLKQWGKSVGLRILNLEEVSHD